MIPTTRKDTLIMATVTRKVDDFDGTTELPDDTKSTRVSLNDARNPYTFEIDLSDANFEKLVKALGPFMRKGREVKRGTPSEGPDAAEKERNAHIRAWRQSQDRSDLPVVNDRGRIPNAVVEAYEREVENANA